jgi:hypothetical protein
MRIGSAHLFLMRMILEGLLPHDFALWLSVMAV